MQIPITKVFFDDAEKEAIVKPLETGWIVQGPYVSSFENLFSDFILATYSKAVSSCTTALHLALEALSIGKGNKVIVPSFTYVATANAVEYTGAEVVFCDIDLKTFNIDVSQCEALLKKDDAIVAIMPVHLFGLCADMTGIMELAQKYNLKIIEDAACAFDAWIGDQHAGLFGDVGCFSFHPRKSITTGEGGMVVTNNENLFNTVKQLCDHGASKSDLERHEGGGSLLPDFNMRGFNYRMTDFQGAVGVCQMQKAPSIMSSRRTIANWYNEALKKIPQLVTPIVPDNHIHGYQSYVCLYTDGEDISRLNLDKIDRINMKRNVFMEHLEKVGIASRQGTHAVHTLSYYKNRYRLKAEDYLMSYAADRLSISLPLYAQMTRAEFDYVINQMSEILTSCAV